MPTSFHFFPTRSRITEGKEKDDPKTIPLKIFAKDIGNCAYVRPSSSALNEYFLFVCPSGASTTTSGANDGTYTQLDIFIMPPKRFPQAKTLAVSNTDSTTDVIRMALLQFGISVSKPQLMLSSITSHYTLM